MSVTVTGNYRLVLHPGADPEAFEAHIASGALGGVLQLTRITSGFEERLLRVIESVDDDDDDTALGRQYTWQVSASLVGGGIKYRYPQNLERLQIAVADFATVIGVDSYAVISTETG